MQISLEAARRNAKLTQKDAAKQIGVSRVTIGKWERGECFPDAFRYQRLCNLYQISMDDIFLSK